MKHSFPVERIIWSDHYSVDSWERPFDLPGLGRCVTCVTIGYRVAETDDSVYLANTINSDDYATGVMVVLKALIQSRVLIDYAEQNEPVVS